MAIIASWCYSSELKHPHEQHAIYNWYYYYFNKSKKWLWNDILQKYNQYLQYSAYDLVVCAGHFVQPICTQLRSPLLQRLCMWCCICLHLPGCQECTSGGQVSCMPSGMRAILYAFMYQSGSIGSLPVDFLFFSWPSSFFHTTYFFKQYPEYLSF